MKYAISILNTPRTRSATRNLFMRIIRHHDINLLTPNVNYSGRTAPLTSKVAFYIFIQQIWALNILNMVYTLPDRLCGLVVRVSGYRYRGPGFDPRRYQIF